MASIAISASGCGSQGQAPPRAEAKDTKADSPYVEVLLGFRDAARSNVTYDAYGYAEYLPDSQRAAIGAFCLVVDDVRAGAESEKLASPEYLSDRIAAAVGSEARAATEASIKRAVKKLQAVIESESLDGGLVKSYAKACY
jgi:hypothetical protein